jgi:hypothetical protein
MKKFNVLSCLIGFFAGIVICVIIIIIICSKYPCGNKCPIATKMLTIEQAGTYYWNYMKTAKPFNDTIKAYTVTKDQIRIMNMMVYKDTSLFGCRIYHGIDASNATIGIILGYDMKFEDSPKNIYYSISPCPPVCDTRRPCPPLCEPH